MSSQPNRPHSQTDEVKQKLDLLQRIEKLGGSAEYSKNPEAFQDIVTTLDTYDASAVSDAINRLSSNAHPSAQALKSKLQGQAELRHTDPESAQKARVSFILQGIENLGGSAGFKKYIESPVGQNPAVTSQGVVENGWEDSYAWGFIDAGFIYTWVDLFTDGHSGTGGSWGLSIGGGNLEGNLSHAPWSELRSAENDFVVESIVDEVAMSFSIGGGRVAQFTGGNIGALVSVGFSGYMDWS